MVVKLALGRRIWRHSPEIRGVVEPHTSGNSMNK